MKKLAIGCVVLLTLGVVGIAAIPYLLSRVSSTDNSSTLELVERLAAPFPLLVNGTGSVGNARYNLDLSTRRAAALARRLTTQHGIAAARLSTRGFGPDRPPARRS
jgi:hypothetical protein